MVAPSLCTSQELITASLAVWGQELMSFPFSIHPDVDLQAVSSQAGQGQGSMHPSESRTLRMGSGQGPLLQVGLCRGGYLSVGTSAAGWQAQEQLSGYPLRLNCSCLATRKDRKVSAGPALALVSCAELSGASFLSSTHPFFLG